MGLRFSAVILCLALAIGTLAANYAALVEVALAQSIASTEQDAVQLIHNYNRWINQKKYEGAFGIWEKRKDGNAVNGQSLDRKSTRLNSSHIQKSRMPSSA